MAYFPMCIDLEDKPVLLVGAGPQISDKAQKLRPFGCRICFLEALTADDLDCRPALVVVGDTPEETAARWADLCRERSIPVNVVDKPGLCSFTFPALVTDGSLTVAVSTGGKSPAMAACIAERIRKALPSRAGELLQWLSSLRHCMSFAQRRRAAQAALDKNRPLTEEELVQIK